jgi:hypothetical protein
MSVAYSWQGATTDTTHVVSIETVGSFNARLVVSTSSALTNPVYGPTVAVNGWGKLTIDGLTANTAYHWGVELNGTLDPYRGKFRTAPTPGTPHSFSFAAASCGQTGSNALTFERIQDRDPAFMLHMGDLHYSDINVNNVETFRTAFRNVLASARQRALYNNVPLFYVWDDHDYGPNGASKSSTSRPAALSTYREVVPHPPLAFSGPANDTPVSQTFTWGRCTFVSLDTRSERVSGKLIGDVQLAWLLDIINNFTGALLVIQCGVPWISGSSTDTWFGATVERASVANAIANAGLINRVLFIHGDAHSVNLDDGRNNKYATDWPNLPGPPVVGLAPLDRSNSVKGGPYSHGSYTDSQTQYGVVDIADNGTTINVTVTGYRADTDAALASLSFTTTEIPPPAPPPSPLTGPFQWSVRTEETTTAQVSPYSEPFTFTIGGDPGEQTLSLRFWNGMEWVWSDGVHYWDGSSWTPVVSMSRWTGTSWRLFNLRAEPDPDPGNPPFQWTVRTQEAASGEVSPYASPFQFTTGT